VPDFSTYGTEAEIKHPEHGLDINSTSLPHKLIPTPATVPPPNCTFASGLKFSLFREPLYSRVFFFKANFDTKHVALMDLKVKLEKIVPQHEFTSGSFDANGVLERKVPGLIKLLPGVPFAIEHSHLPSTLAQSSSSHLAALETHVMYSTWDTLKDYPRLSELKRWFHKLELATWGNPKLKELPIWDCGLASNLRSTNPGSVKDSDGSFSVAFTLEECDIGLLRVAKQTGNLQFQWRRNQLVIFCDLIANYVIEITLLPHELRLWRLLVEINNAATFGKSQLWSSIQLNHSTGVRNLQDAIGKVQGQIHTDPGDWAPSYTVFILWIRFRKGKDLCKLVIISH
jgi:hypothetical protein